MSKSKKLKQARYKPPPLFVIEPQAAILTGVKDSECRAALGLTSQDGKTALVRLRKEFLSEFATAAFGAIGLSQKPINHTSEALPTIISRTIPADGLRVLPPEGANAPVGHAVLEISIGDVPMQFSAPSEVWKEMFAVLASAATPDKSHH
ncbi:MAG: hypothetical protein QM780_06815 [Hyphomicrobium sp.]|uniref:hypothetical protein n=1 Tax=Hyphomicrobium sp. TaxID=82 RepID=UPI0039E302BD